MQLTMREWRRDLARKELWIGVGAVGLVLGIAGPFGTDAEMRLVPRLAYWLALAALTWATGSLIVPLAMPRLSWMGRWMAPPCAGALAGVVIAAEVLALNWLLFGISPWEPETAGTIIAIAMVISVAGYVIETGGGTPAKPEPPRLLQRLPLDRRGRLISMSVADHYVEVTTSAGTALLLMRLSDAIAETGDTEGLQIHRSHWVALDAVRAARRDGQGAVLTLTDGRELPVSRANLAKVKAAGLLPA